MIELLVSSLEDHEGRRRKVYRCTSGKKSIGVGHNIDAKGLPQEIEDFLEENGYITEGMIEELLDADIKDAMNDAHKLYPEMDSFSDNRQVALIDFVFNVGYGTARTFINTNRAINQGQWEKAAEMLLESKYARQVGRRANDISDMLREG
jgi:lysozyme